MLTSNATIVLLQFMLKNTHIRHFWSKIPKSGNFRLKLRHFCFFAKFCNYTNSRVLISNMTILFSNSSLKILKSGISGRKFMHFWFFVKFCQSTNLRVLISNMTIVFFMILAQKYPYKAVLVTKMQIRHFWCEI